MSSVPIISPSKPPSDAEFTRNGAKFSRAWTILAGSELEARQILKAQTGFIEGVPFKDFRGNVPDPLSVCQRITVKQSTPLPPVGTSLWAVAAYFERESQSGGSGGKNDRQPEPGGPVIFHYEDSQASQPMDVDFKGTKVATSAGEPFKSVTTIRTSRILVGRWYEYADSEIILSNRFNTFADTVNSVDFFTSPRGSYRFISVKPTEKSPGLFLLESRQEYRSPLNFFGKAVEGWQHPEYDRGLNELSAGVPPFTAILDPKTQQPVTVPVELDGNGHANLPGKQPVVLVFDRFGYTDHRRIFPPGLVEW